jgi:hypothetical protein
MVSDNLPGREPGAKARAEAQKVRAAEAAATRRRWITLGEVLAVLAICISALTLWNSWIERSTSDAVKNADAQRASTRAVTLVLMATNSGERKLTLKPASSDQTVQSQKIMFPTALGVAPAETTGEARIEASWFEHTLKNARGAAHLPDDSRGDERLPVAITTRFLVDGEPHEDTALYDIGYGISGHWFSGHSVNLRGISLVSRAKSGSMQAKLDARWSRLFLKR